MTDHLAKNDATNDRQELLNLLIVTKSPRQWQSRGHSNYHISFGRTFGGLEVTHDTQR